MAGGLTVAGFVEAMRRVAVGGEDCDAVAKLLKPDGGIDNEPLCAAYAEVGVEEYDTLSRRHYGSGVRSQLRG